MDWKQTMIISAIVISSTWFMHMDHCKEIREIHKEMSDFHGRLERQDAEFKAHMVYYHSAE
jgi:hypothetical protein